jgi:hypothetical protein
VMIPLTALAGIMTYAWPFAQTEESLIVVTVLYGFVFFFSKPVMKVTHLLKYSIGSVQVHMFHFSAIP